MHVWVFQQPSPAKADEPLCGEAFFMCLRGKPLFSKIGRCDMLNALQIVSRSHRPFGCTVDQRTRLTG